MTEPQGPARLRDVARAAGVHLSTASRALHGAGDDRVSASTRARVREAARRLDYHPDATARTLRTRRTGALGMLVPSLRNPVMADVVRGAMVRAWELGLVLLLTEDEGSDSGHAEVYDRLVTQGRIDGLLVASARGGAPMFADLAASGLPCVFVGRRHARPGRNVSLREEEIGALAARHLVELGHRRLGHVAGPEGVDITDRRLAGFTAAAERAGAGVAVVHAALTEAGGADGVRALTGGSVGNPTGIFVTNWNQTFGVLGALRAAGLAVPADVSVVACDDDPAFGYLDPPVTAVRMPLAELGAAAVDALLAQLDGHPAADVDLDLPARLTLRASTAAPGGPA